MTTRTRRPRGSVMVMVLLVLLLLSLLVTGFYLSSADSAATSRIVVGQQVAMAHADTGLQDALRAIRAQQLDLSGITVQCTSAEVEANTCATTLRSGTVDHGSTVELGANGGLQYEYIIYRKPNALDPGQPGNRYVIRSIGYHGFTMNAKNLITSIVEAEIDIGKSGEYECTNGYECQ